MQTEFECKGCGSVVFLFGVDGPLDAVSGGTAHQLCLDCFIRRDGSYPVNESEPELRARARAFADAASIAEQHAHHAENPVSNLRMHALVARLQSVAAHCELRARKAEPSPDETELDQAHRQARAAELHAAELHAAALRASAPGPCTHPNLGIEFGCPACMARVAEAHAKSLALTHARVRGRHPNIDKRFAPDMLPTAPTPMRARLWEITLKNVMEQLDVLSTDEERAHVLRAAQALIAKGRAL
jgi:hypothetical protein